MNISLSCIKASASWVACFALLITASCSQHSSVADSSKWREINRVDVFYRSFSQLAPVRFTRDDIQRSASTKVTLRGKEEISDMLDSIALRCAPASDVSDSEMDLYVLIRAYGRGIQPREWKASPFHFYDSAVGKVCTLKIEDRERLSAVIEAVSGPKSK